MYPDYLVDDNKVYNVFHEWHVCKLQTNSGKADILWFIHIAADSQLFVAGKDWGAFSLPMQEDINGK